MDYLQKGELRTHAQPRNPQTSNVVFSQTGVHVQSHARVGLMGGVQHHGVPAAINHLVVQQVIERNSIGVGCIVGRYESQVV